jgi:hypothetical protein
VITLRAQIFHGLSLPSVQILLPGQLQVNQYPARLFPFIGAQFSDGFQALAHKAVLHDKALLESRVVLALENASFSAWTAFSSSLPASTPPLRLKS